MEAPTGLTDFTARVQRFLSFSLKTITADDLENGAGLCEQEFNTLALDLFRLQFEANAPYRAWCKSKNASPERVNDWTAIPVLPVAAFKELPVSCLAEDERTREFRSSGTTGAVGSRHFHNEASLEIYEASLWLWFERHLLTGLAGSKATRLLCLTPGPSQAPHSSLVHMFDTIRRKLDAPADTFLARVSPEGNWHVNISCALKSVQQAEEQALPVTLLGTAFSFVHLLDSMDEQGVRFQLPVGSRAMETGGYKGRSRVLTREQLHGAIESRFGIAPKSVISEYGMAELSSQAYDCAAGSGGGGKFRFPPWARVRIVSPETGREVADGEVGLIQVFDLANVYSVFALQTEDLGRKRGAGFELIGRAETAGPRGCSLMLG